MLKNYTGFSGEARGRPRHPRGDDRHSVPGRSSLALPQKPPRLACRTERNRTALLFPPSEPTGHSHDTQKTGCTRGSGGVEPSFRALKRNSPESLLQASSCRGLCEQRMIRDVKLMKTSERRRYNCDMRFITSHPFVPYSPRF